MLWLDQDQVILIDVKAKYAKPYVRSHAELEELLQDPTVVQHVAGEPYRRVKRAESDIPPKLLAKRDRRWAVVGPIVELPNGEPNPAAFDVTERERLITAAIAAFTATGQSPPPRESIIAWMTRYWQRGMTKNALVPDYDRCGGKGKPRDAAPHAAHTGRLYKHTILTGEPAGIAITGDVLTILVKGFVYYEKMRRKSFTEALNWVWAMFFSLGVEVDKDGTVIPQLMAPHERPTNRQFRYHYDRYRKGDLTRSLKRTKGERAFNLRHRSLSGGGATQRANGPGALFLIDAFIGDLYLRSALAFYHLRLIGRPIGYYVVDVFSRMIVGISVELEGPSWFGMAGALENTASDKVAFCARYNITITPDMWPCQHLPDALLGDRGELISRNAGNLRK